MTAEHIGICKLCGKESVYPFKSKIRDYCSHACSNKAKWENRERAAINTYQCLKCEKPFTLLSYLATHREKSGKGVKYCTRECARAAQILDGTKVSTQCAHCQKPLTRRRDSLRARSFCGPLCWSEATRTTGSTWSNHDPDKAARRVYMRNYVQANRDRKNALSRAWAIKNRDYRRYIDQVRRAAGSLTFTEWKELIDSSQGQCSVCGSTEQPQVDHIVPVARGGKTERANLQVLCKFCNVSKGAKDFKTWLKQRELELCT